jgi:hypothetical protein
LIEQLREVLQESQRRQSPENSQSYQQLQQQVGQLQQEIARLRQKLESQSSSQQQEEVPLKSAVGYDYTKLRDLLAAGMWKEADEETVKAIKYVTGLDLINISLEKIPDRDISSIDYLWVRYSNGRFGLSIQKEIYQRLEPPSEIDKERLQRFGYEIGWYENGKWKYYNQLNFNLSGDIPYGHLPAGLWFNNQDDWEMNTYRTIGVGSFLLLFLLLPWGVISWLISEQKGILGVALKDFAVFIVFLFIYIIRGSSKDYCINESNVLENIRFLTSLQITSSGSQVELHSAVGYDYTKLRDLLAKQKWQEADEETAKAMLKVAGRDDYLREEDIDNFPCEDLRTIDRLWLKSSNGKFGFSVQKQIYQSNGGTKSYNRQIWQKFGDTVGWREDGQWKNLSELNWNTPTTSNTPPGHLPWVGTLCGSVGWWGVVSSLAQRLVNCNI